MFFLLAFCLQNASKTKCDLLYLFVFLSFFIKEKKTLKKKHHILRDVWQYIFVFSFRKNITFYEVKCKGRDSLCFVALLCICVFWQSLHFVNKGPPSFFWQSQNTQNKGILYPLGGRVKCKVKQNAHIWSNDRRLHFVGFLFSLFSF